MRTLALVGGVLLIAFGALAGASTGAVNAQAARNNVPADQRFWNAVGGALCSLVCVGGGILSVAVGTRKPARVRSRSRADKDDRDDEGARSARPWDTRQQ
ncbi:unnamed protein product [Gemmata massiliana]|uniref:Uncharacterized protein n=1 Tax=Gemmata massiliana TaxID=1210884 RepID=A0A6P2D0K4_9BACT|nr:hypothetical protein [Gemmata massiliana]VTR94781.1 unnamed protein product [Gemmata massiliana]